MAQRMWINGEFTSGSARDVIEVLNPYTEMFLDTVPAGTAEDVACAVQAAFGEWRWIPAVERADFLHRVAARLRENEDALARQLTLKGGNPLVGNLDEVGWAAACFDLYWPMV